MARPKSEPLKITAYLKDGRINSADGVLMFDSILYHAWFMEHAPHVLHGEGVDNYNGYIGLPICQMTGNRWRASKGIFQERGQNVEYYYKKPDFFAADKIDYLKDEKGLISGTVGKYRAYRMLQVIRTTDKIEFYALGNADKISSLLKHIHCIGKKPSMGYGFVRQWDVEKIKHDYSVWHPEYGLMRPVPVDQADQMPCDLSAYPIMVYGTRPPYWKRCNMELCYVPIGGKT